MASPSPAGLTADISDIFSSIGERMAEKYKKAIHEWLQPHSINYFTYSDIDRGFSISLVSLV